MARLRQRYETSITTAYEDIAVLNPCQRSMSYRQEDCDPDKCQAPWCAKERKKRGLDQRPHEDQIARDNKTYAQQPAYAHGYHGVTYGYGRWRVRIRVLLRKAETFAIFPGTEEGELEAARFYDRFIKNMNWLDKLPLNFPEDVS